MQSISVREIIAAVDGRLTGAFDLNRTVCDVGTDSRSIKTGALFVPVAGDKFDGHDYIEAALENGALGCLTAKDIAHPRSDKFYIRVKDTRLALKALASWYREGFDIPFIQITGSVGKTTTKEMIAAVLGEGFNVLKTPENFNNDVGVPRTLFMLDQAHEAAVIETGMNHFGEIRYLGEMVRPDIAVISNIGDAHIEFLGSREGILKAKCEIFENLKKGGAAVLNGDDPLLNTVNVPFETHRCGKGENCDVRVTAIEDRGIDGVNCTVTTEKSRYELVIPAPGLHMIYAAAMAVAVGEKLGMTRSEIERGVAHYEPTGERMRVIPVSGGRKIISDCYNANPQSMAAAIEILAGTEGKKRIAVLGDMGELGDISKKSHEAVGRLCGESRIDTVIAIGLKAEDIAAGAASYDGVRVYHFDAKEDARDALRDEFTDGAVALVKASHAMQFGDIVKELQK